MMRKEKKRKEEKKKKKSKKVELDGKFVRDRNWIFFPSSSSVCES